MSNIHILNILKQKGSSKGIFTEIKSTFSASEVLKFTDDIRYGKHLEKYAGNILLSYLSPEFVDPPTFFTNNLEHEIEYFFYSLHRGKEVIKKFIPQKQKIEDSILLGDYSTALDAIERWRDSFGVSLWYYELKLFIQEQTEGSQYNWKFLSELDKENPINPLSHYILQLLSNKYEAKFSADNFRKALHDELNLNFANPIDKAYIKFKVSNPYLSLPEELPGILYLEEALPIVDRYNSYKRILEILLSTPQHGYQGKAIGICRKLSKLFPEDPTYDNALILHSKRPLTNLDLNHAYNVFLDKGVSGEPQHNTFLQDNFLDVNILYQKAEYQKDIPKNDKAKSIISKLETALHDVVQKTPDFETSLNYLKKLNLSIISFNAFPILNHIIENELQQNGLFSNMGLNLPLTYFLPLKYFDVKSITYCRNIDNKTLLEQAKPLLSDVPNLLLVLSSLVENNLSDLDRAKILPDHYTLLKGTILYRKGELSKQVHFLKSKLPTVESKYFLSRIISSLVNSYEEQNDLNSLISIVGYYLVNDPILIKGINLDRIAFRFVDDNDNPVYQNIYLSIIQALSDLEYYQNYIAYDNFLSIKGVQTASELIESETSTKELIFFFENVCIIPVMQYSPAFENYTEVEAERIKLLTYLSKADYPNEEKHLRDIAEITQRTIIRKGINQYNKSRITLATYELQKRLIEKISAQFKRFKEQLEFVQEENLQVEQNVDGLIDVEIDLKELGSFKTRYSPKDPAFISFSILFYEIQDVFLFDKENGLDGYLSTRIRHGAFINHIKSAFTKLHLLASKMETGYRPVSFWNQYENLIGEESLNHLQNKLIDFSKQVDEYLNTIRSDYLQIKTESKNNTLPALFDYTITPQDLSQLYAIVTSDPYSEIEFIELVFTYLKNKKTDILLEKTREFVQTKMYYDISRKIDVLKQELTEIVDSGLLITLNDALTSCKTEISRQLETIADWFYLAENDTSFLVSWLDILKIGVEFSNTLYPNNFINPQLSTNTDTKAFYNYSLIDILRILIDNAIEHSKLTIENLELSLSVDRIDSSTLCLSVQHKLNEIVDIKALKQTMEEIKQNWNKENFYELHYNKEGKSGLKKIRRLLVLEYGEGNNSFDYFIEDKKFAQKFYFQTINLQ